MNTRNLESWKSKDNLNKTVLCYSNFVFFIRSVLNLLPRWTITTTTGILYCHKFPMNWMISEFCVCKFTTPLVYTYSHTCNLMLPAYLPKSVCNDLLPSRYYEITYLYLLSGTTELDLTINSNHIAKFSTITKHV